MGLHALLDPYDSTGYTPSIVNYARLLPHIRIYNHLKAFAPETAVLRQKNVSSDVAAGVSQSSFVWKLSAEEIGDIETSMRYFSSLKLPLNAIDQETFPMTEALGSKLRDVAVAVYGQPQFMIISGLNPILYTDEENVIIHAGLACHVGIKRGMPGREGGDNTVLHHIVAMITSPRGTTGQYHAPPNQTRDIPFHTDIGDIVSLFALSTSETGGKFYLADSTEVFNDLKALKPKLAQALVEDWIMVSPSPARPYDLRPVAFPQEDSGRVLINCSRARITGTPSAPRPPSLPALTRIQKQALDSLHILATRRALAIPLRAGDMVFFNNLTMLHARDGFIDNGAKGHKRHLLRLILRNEEMAYKLPPQLVQTWEALYKHNVEEEVFPIKRELFSFAASH